MEFRITETSTSTSRCHLLQY